MGILYRIWLVFLSALQQPNQKVPNHIAKLDTSQGENRNGKKTEILLTCLRLKSCLLCHVCELLVSVQVQRGLCEKVRFFFFPSCPGNRAMLTVCLLEGGKITGKVLICVCSVLGTGAAKQRGAGGSWGASENQNLCWEISVSWPALFPGWVKDAQSTSYSMSM